MLEREKDLFVACLKAKLDLEAVKAAAEDEKATKLLAIMIAVLITIDENAYVWLGSPEKKI